MKKFLLTAVLALGFSIIAVAQDTPVAEIFGGYSYVRPDTEEGVDAINMNGWNVSVGLPGTKHLGFVMDFGGVYGSFDDYEEDVDVKLHTVMFGPKFTVRMGKVTPFAQALFGYARMTAKSFQEVELMRENNFAYALGGGIDINLTDMVAVRPAQIEYLAVRSQGDMTHNFRYSAGIVLKLGKR